MATASSSSSSSSFLCSPVYLTPGIITFVYANLWRAIKLITDKIRWRCSSPFGHHKESSFGCFPHYSLARSLPGHMIVGGGGLSVCLSVIGGRVKPFLSVR